MRNALLVGLNRSSILILGMVAEALADIFFDYTLIFGQFGRQLLDSLALVCSVAAAIWLNVVTGTGKSKVTFLIELAVIILYCLYVYVVLDVKRLSITCACSSALLYWIALFLLSFQYIKSSMWKAQTI